MKATGIVRRIDELGRVVIPKELRKTLRIREGDPLEIFLDNEGGIIFKKYSPLNNLGNYAELYANTLHKITGYPIIIADQDYLVASAGVPIKDVSALKVNPALETMVNPYKPHVIENNSDKLVYPSEALEIPVVAAMLIVADNEPAGTILILENQNLVKLEESDLKLLAMTAQVLGTLLMES